MAVRALPLHQRGVLEYLRQGMVRRAAGQVPCDVSALRLRQDSVRLGRRAESNPKVLAAVAVQLHLVDLAGSGNLWRVVCFDA